MPIYAYKCSSCGFAKDVLQKMSDPPLVVCPACGEATFGKQVTAAGFQLKGSGWYVTDFKGSQQQPAAKNGAEAGKSETNSEGQSDAAGNGKGTTGSESKPAAADPVASTSKAFASAGGAAQSGTSTSSSSSSGDGG